MSNVLLISTSASQVPLRLVRTFYEVAHIGSFTAAARELGVSQPAVSQQIRELESVLGTTLFRRRGRGVELTGAGAMLAESVDPAISRLERGLDRFLAARSPNHVEVRVNSTFATRWLIPRLGSFLQRHPDLEVDLTTNYWPETADPDREAIHIDFGAVTAPAEAIGDPEVVIAVASPATARRITTTRELFNETLLEIRGGDDNWAAYCSAIGVAPQPTRTHSSMTYLHTLALAEAGHGVALAHRFIVADDLRRGSLAQVATPPVPAHEQYYLLAPRQDRVGAGTATLLGWLRRTVGIDGGVPDHRR